MKKVSLIICALIGCSVLFSCNGSGDAAKNQKIIDSLVQRQTFVADSINLNYKSMVDSMAQSHKAIMDSMAAPKGLNKSK